MLSILQRTMCPLVINFNVTSRSATLPGCRWHDQNPKNPVVIARDIACDDNEIDGGGQSSNKVHCNFSRYQSNSRILSLHLSDTRFLVGFDLALTQKESWVEGSAMQFRLWAPLLRFTAL